MHVIITGGSSGIGLEVARSYLKNGHRVSIIARDTVRLASAKNELAAISAMIDVVEADVCDIEGITSAIQFCELNAGPCDLLVTSAGVVEPALFQDADHVSFRRQIDTNLMGTVNAVNAIYAGMRARGHGAIMLISSAAGHLGIPGYTAYCASKAAVASFAESLRCEAEKGIYVGVCFPPDTQTPQLVQELKSRPYVATLLIGKSKPWPVKKIAQQIVVAIEGRKPELHFGFRLKALALFGGIVKPVLYCVLAHRRR